MLSRITNAAAINLRSSLTPNTLNSDIGMIKYFYLLALPK